MTLMNLLSIKYTQIHAIINTNIHTYILYSDEKNYIWCTVHIFSYYAYILTFIHSYIHSTCRHFRLSTHILLIVLRFPTAIQLPESASHVTRSIRLRNQPRLKKKRLLLLPYYYYLSMLVHTVCFTSLKLIMYVRMYIPNNILLTKMQKYILISKK